MRRTWVAIILVAVVVAFALAGESRRRHLSFISKRPVKTLGRIPLYFEGNAGQTDPRVRFIARSRSYTAFLTAEGVVFAVDGGRDVVRMRLEGAAVASEIRGEFKLPGFVNYFVGDASRWRSGVATYRNVAYKSVYPGTDMLFHGSDRLEFDFVLQPGADSNRIRLHFSKNVSIDQSGNLILAAAAGQVRLEKPVLFQPGGGRVDGRFVQRSDNEVGFIVAPYDATRELTIDPVLSYSTYLGGSDDEGIFGVKQDSNGYIYLSGETSSLNFPTLHPVQAAVGGDYDAFVAKLDPSGTQLIYSTYLGGSGYDHAVGLALGDAGSVYVAGITQSTDFPTARALQTALKGDANAFVAKLDGSGTHLVFSTYFGGSDFDSANDLILDSKGNLVIAGNTSSLDFPITAGAYQTVCDGGTNVGFCVGDAFVSKISSDGSKLIYSTFLGGSEFDAAYGVALDSNGNPYITGSTESTNFPLKSAYQTSAGGEGDAFVAKLNANVTSLLFSTYLGGASEDMGTGIAVGNQVVVTGTTMSTNFPVVHPFQAANHGGGDAFVAALPLTGQGLAYSSYLGGSAVEIPFRVALDGAGNASVIGFTASTDFPTVHPLQSAFAGGVADVFVSRVNASGSALTFSTYLGGAGDDYGYAIHSDAAGNLLIGGSTSSTDFPLAHPFQNAYGGGPYDAFLSKIGAGTQP